MSSNAARNTYVVPDLPEVSTAFVVTGEDFDPRQITAAVGLRPTHTWRLGDLVGRSTVRRKHNGWVVRNGPQSRFDWDAQMRELLDVVEPKADEIRSVLHELGASAEISCVAYIAEATPSFHLTEVDLRRISTVQAEVDLDLIRAEVRETGSNVKPWDVEAIANQWRAWFDLATDITIRSSSLGVIEAAKALELVAKSVGPDEWASRTLSELIPELKQRGSLGRSDAQFLLSLWLLRNEALHSIDLELDRRDVNEMIKRSSQIAELLISVARRTRRNLRP